MNTNIKLACLFFITIVAGCTKDKSQIREQSSETQKRVNAPGITFSPAIGVNYSAVSISGNFSTIPGANVVKFNGKTGIINSVAADKIVVTVPATATTGKVTVTTNNTTLTSATDFKVLKLLKQDTYQTPLGVRYFIFSRSGNGAAYIVTQTQKIYLINSNGTIKLFYSVPPKIVDGSYVEDYRIHGIDTDGDGNVIISQIQFGSLEGSNDIIKSIVLKITPAGKVTQVLSTQKNPVYALMWDRTGSNLIYMLGDFSMNKFTNTGQKIVLPWPVPAYGGAFVKDKYDNYYTLDANQIKRVGTSGSITTISGRQNIAGETDGQIQQATFTSYSTIAVDSAQNIFMLHLTNSLNNQKVRMVNTAGYASTLSFPTAGDNERLYADPYTNNLYHVLRSDNKQSTITRYAFK